MRYLLYFALLTPCFSQVSQIPTTQCQGCSPVQTVGIGSVPATIWNWAYDTPFGQGYVNLADFDWSSVTHIAIVGGTPQADGTIVLTAGFTAHAQALIALAHAHGVKVLFTLGAEGGGSYDFAGAITNHLSALVTNTMAVVNADGFDGVDEDFESGYTQPLMASLLTAMRTALGSNLLTAAAFPNSSTDWPLTGMGEKVDRINLLSYDLGCCSTLSFFNAGLYCIFDTEDCIQKYVDEFVSNGNSASKINIGLPFFGILETGGPTGPRQTQSGSTQAEVNYNVIVASHSATMAAATWDAQAHAPWGTDSGGYLNWDNEQSLTDKAFYVFQSGLGGWFTWNLGTEYFAGQSPTHPLQNALKLAYLGFSQSPRPNFTGIANAVNSTNIRTQGSAVQVLADFTTAANTSLQSIVDGNGNGLRWYNPAFGKYRASFSCDLIYSQATGNVAVAFGIQEQSHIASTSPTNIMATGSQQITVGPPATYAAGSLTGLNSTTATNIVSGTPGAIATKYTVHLGGTIEMPLGTPATWSAEQFQIMVSTATSGDAVTVYRGSSCIFGQ